MPRINRRSSNCGFLFLFFTGSAAPQPQLKVFLEALRIPGSFHTCPENSFMRLPPRFPLLLRISAEPLILVSADGQGKHHCWWSPKRGWCDCWCPPGSVLRSPCPKLRALLLREAMVKGSEMWSLGHLSFHPGSGTSLCDLEQVDWGEDIGEPMSWECGGVKMRKFTETT